MTTLATRAQSLLDTIRIADTGPDTIGRLVSFDGVMLEATGLDLPVGSGVRICGRGQSDVLAEIIGFKDDRSLLMTISGNAMPVCGARVIFDGHASEVDVGPALLGRVIDASGLPLDGLGPINAGQTWPLAGRQTNPLQRGRVVEPLDVGVRSINALLCCGVGQRVAIIAGSGVGKSVLMGQIVSGADADVVVIGMIGERSREVSDFVSQRLGGIARARSIVVAVPADHAPLLRIRAAMRATAIAEHFRASGHRVLLFIDSLTRIAHAQRELGLSLGEPAATKGYPPSAFGLIPRLVERAGNDLGSGGSITAFYTVLADGDDADDPIVDAARAIADGHIMLSRTLAEQSVFPAIDVGKSISRVMHDLTTAAHAQSAARFRQAWSIYEENRDLILMGAYAHGSDDVIDDAIERRAQTLDFLRQPADQLVPFEAAVAQLEQEFAA